MQHLVEVFAPLRIPGLLRRCQVGAPFPKGIESDRDTVKLILTNAKDQVVAVKAKMLFEAAQKRKPGEGQPRNCATGRMSPIVDNVNDRKERPTGNSAAAGLRKRSAPTVEDRSRAALVVAEILARGVRHIGIHLGREFETLAHLAARGRQVALRAEVVNKGTANGFGTFWCGLWLVRSKSIKRAEDCAIHAHVDSHAEVAAALAAGPACSRLRCHCSYAECGFAKGAYTCNTPEHMEGCPVPRHDLRNGRLNQTAYSLALFLRDVGEGDLVGWLDARLYAADGAAGPERVAALRDAVLAPLCSIYGVSAKVWSMALADLLLAGDPERERWRAAGAGMIAVDTLVHNWLHRSGCLADLGAEHPFGLGCYAYGGCADIIEAARAHIDARRYCPEGPADFPRLVQKAIWLLCTESGFDLCNGNRIDDRHACPQDDCPVATCCQRQPLCP